MNASDNLDTLNEKLKHKKYFFTPKAIFFFQCGAAASLLRYDVLYYEKINLNESQIGLIKMICIVSNCIGSVAMGYLTDATGKSNIYLYSSYIFNIVLTLCCSLTLVAKHYIFLLLVVAIANIFGGGVRNAVDNYVLSLCSTLRMPFGKQRLFSAVGWGMIGLLTGLLLRTSPTEAIFYIFGTLSFVALALLMYAHIEPATLNHIHARNIDAQDPPASPSFEVQAMLHDSPKPEIQDIHDMLRVSTALEADDPVKKDHSPTPTNPPTTSKIIYTLDIIFSLSPKSLLSSNYVFLLLLLNLFMFGFLMSPVEIFLFLYVKNDLQGETDIMGIALLIMTLSEVPVFYFSERILESRWVNGYKRCFFVSQLLLALRLYLYTLLTPKTARYIYFIEVLHGMTFAMLWAISVVAARAIAPNNRYALFQSIVAACYEGLGLGVGSYLGGILWNAIDTRVFLHAYAIATIVYMIIFFFVFPDGYLLEYKYKDPPIIHTE